MKYKRRALNDTPRVLYVGRRPVLLTEVGSGDRRQTVEGLLFAKVGKDVRNECLTDADERRRSPNIGQSHSDIGARRRVSRTSATTPGLIPVSRATSSTQRLRSHRLLFCIALISSQLGSLGGCRLSYSHSAHHRRSGSSPKATGTTLELSL